MMNKNNLSKSCWAKVASIVVYLLNTCTTSGVHDITSHKKYYGRKPNLSDVRIFGIIVYMHLPDETWQKLEQKGYTSFNPSTKKITIEQGCRIRRIRILIHV